MRVSPLSRFTFQRRAAMNLEGTEDSASRFAAYVGQVTGVIGHADRVRPLNDYCAGLLSQRAAGAWNRSQRSRPRPRLRCSRELAFSLPKRAWRTIAWREGTNDKLRSRFARVRVRTAPIRGVAKRGEETLLIEWPEGEPQPTKYWLATVEKNISFRALVDLAKMRWRVERDYLELKQEVGLGHYEGRGWPGFHHHGTLCSAVYGFLISEREMIPPSGPHCAGKLKNLPFPIVTDPAAPPIR